MYQGFESVFNGLELLASEFTPGRVVGVVSELGIATILKQRRSGFHNYDGLFISLMKRAVLP
jgi:hypothetical protein